jgi:hypothetical protein
MVRALERHQRRDVRVVPVILRPADWHHTPFAKLQALPKDGKPVTTWQNQDEALLNVALGLRAMVESILRDGAMLHGSDSDHKGSWGAEIRVIGVNKSLSTPPIISDADDDRIRKFVPIKQN